MVDFVYKFSYDITSQNGENGIINECIFRIKPGLKVAVEFGAPDRSYCSNINHLKGWDLRYFSDKASEGVEEMFITPENVNELPECSIMSIDIDGNDFNVWKAYNGKPDIVVIEINSSLDPEVEFFHPEKGASFCTMNRLAEEKGYFLLCHTGNCIYIRNEHKDLFADVKPEFNRSWLQVQV